ncbi:MAG: hypothetical protein Q4C53_08745 [Clostridia bacterium]|nr:hypothetical protein [Clostridia bacterium]
MSNDLQTGTKAPETAPKAELQETKPKLFSQNPEHVKAATLACREARAWRMELEKYLEEHPEILEETP